MEKKCNERKQENRRKRKKLYPKIKMKLKSDI